MLTDASFLPYSLQVLQPLKELFLQDKFSDIPEFTLKPNSDFNLISASLSSLAVTSSNTDNMKDQVGKTFDSLSEYVQDTTNIVRLQSLEYASKNFASILENSYNTFHNGVTPTVESLRTRIETRYVELMKREKAEELLASPSEPSEADYTFIAWDNFKTPIRQTEIIEAACANAGISSPVLSITNQGYIIQKLNFGSEFSNVKLSAEVTATALEKLVATFNTTATETEIKSFLDLITSSVAYTNFSLTYQAKITSGKAPALEVISAIQQTTALAKMVQSAASVLSDVLGAETVTTITANAEALNKTLYGIQYWILVCKELKFKSKLVITKDILNQETFESFTQDGGSISDVHNYIKAFHLDSKPIPLDGIKADVIKNTDVAERLLKASSQLKYNQTLIRSKCLLGAYDLVMQQFATETLASEKYTGNAAQVFKHSFQSAATSKANSLAGDISNLDKALYDVVVNVFYKDDLVSVLYKYLGKNFDSLVTNSASDITDTDILKSQCFATIEMLTDYLFKVLVEPKQ